MIACARDQELLALLDEELDPAGEAPIVAHVEICTRCQKRLENLARRGEPPPSVLPSRSARSRAQGSPAPRSGQLDGSPDTIAAADATLTDFTGYFARIAELVTISDGVPTDWDHLGGCPDPTVVDFHEPADPQAAQGASRKPVGDSQVTTDIIQPTLLERILANAPAVDTDQLTDPGSPLDGDRPVMERGALAPTLHMNPDQSRSGPPEIPGYEVLEKLGEGGMGVVYKARQRGLNRLVALKMIVGGSHARADHLARFRIEAEAVAQLRHPNIMEIYGIGEVGGLPFVALELLEGGDLDDRLAGTPQSGPAGSELVATLARAVHAAHQAGIIHRDLKPNNVLFTACGVPKITDFGLAKRLESDRRQTESGQIMGSPSYMAPEQARGQTKDVGPAADVYALGAILYEVLTGRPPFKGQTSIETMRQVCDLDPVPPSRLVPGVTRDLETICLKCLHKEPPKRYDSAQELADDLDRYRNGNTIHARRTPIWERGVKWARRRPIAAMFVALGMVAFLGLTLGGAIFERRQRFRLVRLDRRYFQDQTRGMALCDEADRASTRAELEKAQSDLGTFHPDVAADPRLTYIAKRRDNKLLSVADRLGVLDSLDAARERDRENRDRYQKFLELRQEAQLYAAVTGMLLSTDRLKKLRGSAHQALAIYAQDPQGPDDAWTLADPLPAALSPAEKAKVKDGCYDLLLILSQTGPTDGLRILDRGMPLRPQATAAYHLRRAFCLERAGDFAGRDRENQAALELEPVTALDYFLSGRELASRGRYRDASRLLETAVQRDLDQTSAHLLLAVCYLNTRPKLLSAARTSLNVCIRSHPDLVGLYLLRASIFGEEGTQAHGKEATGCYEAAEADFRHALDLWPNDELRYVLLANRGLLRLQSDRLREAIADLEAAIRLKATHYQAHNTLAQVYQRQGRLADAFAAFSRAIACQPEPIVLAALHRSRALLYAPKKDLTPEEREWALRDLDEAIRHEPDKGLQAGDHVWRARLYFSAQESQQALFACDAALKLVPDDSEAHRVRIATLMKLQRYDEVLASSDAYLARGKPSSEVFEIRGLARVARRDYAAAIGDFCRALDLEPAAEPARRSRLLNLRGWAYHFADAPRLALADFEESLRLEPNQSDALGGRGLARIRLGQWRPAVADAEAGVRQAQGVTAGSTKSEAQADQVQAFYNAARIYAQAVTFAAQDVSRQGEPSVALYLQYRNRALDLLKECLKRAPDRERREEILADPSLRPLRLRTPGGFEPSPRSPPG